MAFAMPDMSFLYISFVILFCQNNVKKNCKFISRVFKKNDDMKQGKGPGRYLADKLKIRATFKIMIYLFRQHEFIVVANWIYCYARVMRSIL